MPDDFDRMVADGIAVMDANRAAAQGAVLLFDVLDLFLSYVAFPSEEAAWAVTLWVAHTHFAHHLETTPRLAVVSPEPQCGKTRLLEVCELVCARPFNAVNTSVAAMFRLVESENPTLLFDEADTYFGTRAHEHEELRGLINAGHRRRRDGVPMCRRPEKDGGSSLPGVLPGRAGVHWGPARHHLRPGCHCSDASAPS